MAWFIALAWVAFSFAQVFGMAVAAWALSVATRHLKHARTD
jgi:hypothetical protein